MNNVCFDLNEIYWATKTCTETLSAMSPCVFEACKMGDDRLSIEITELSRQYTSAINNIKSEIYVVSAQIEHVAEQRNCAEAQRQKEIEHPPKPSIPDNASPETCNQIMRAYHNRVSEIDAQNHAICVRNREISEYCYKCDDAKKKLEGILTELRRLEERAQKEREHILSQVQNAANHVKEEVSQGRRTVAAFNAFAVALDEVYRAAQNIAEMKASSVKHNVYVDKRFVLQNRHFHNSSVHVSFSLGEKIAASSATAHFDDDPAEERLIKCSDQDAFTDLVRNAYRFRIPCANLHKLGGQTFIEMMELQGFFIKLQPDGSKIDMDGMIHWEKKDV